MVDVKRVKGSYDLAVMNHASLQTEDSLAAMLAAKTVYEAALDAAEEEANALEAFADDHTDEEIEDAQRKLDALKRTKGMPVSKASTSTTGGVRSDRRRSGLPDVAGEVKVTPNRQPGVVPSQTNPAVEVVVSPATTDQDPNRTGGPAATGGTGEGEQSDATKAGQELAAEKKSESTASADRPGE